MKRFVPIVVLESAGGDTRGTAYARLSGRVATDSAVLSVGFPLVPNLSLIVA